MRTEFLKFKEEAKSFNHTANLAHIGASLTEEQHSRKLNEGKKSGDLLGDCSQTAKHQHMSPLALRDNA